MEVSIMDFPLPCLMTKLVNHLQSTGGWRRLEIWVLLGWLPWIPHSDGRKPPMHWFHPNTLGCQSNIRRIWMLIFSHGNLETAIPSPEFYTDSPKRTSSGENRTSRFRGTRYHDHFPTSHPGFAAHENPGNIGKIWKDHDAIPRNVQTCQVGELLFHPLSRSMTYDNCKPIVQHQLYSNKSNYAISN